MPTNTYVFNTFDGPTYSIYSANGSVSKVISNTSSDATNTNGVITRYDENGNFQWTAQMGASVGNSDQHIIFSTGVTTDISNNAYVTGTFNNITFDVYNSDGSLGKTLTNTLGNVVMFIIKYNSSGVCQWITKMIDDDSTANSSISGTSVDVYGNVYTSGTFYNLHLSIYSSDNSLSKTLENSAGVSGSGNLFTIKYDVNGNYKWSAKIGGISTTPGAESTAICIDSDNNVYSVGLFFCASINIYNINNDILQTLYNTSPTIPNKDIFLVKYDTYGNFQWSILIGGDDNSSRNNCPGICTDTINNIYITGSYSNQSLSIYNSSGNLSKKLINTSTDVNNVDVFVIKYNPDGFCLWGATMGSTTESNSLGLSIYADTNNNVYVTGAFDSVSFDIYGQDESLTPKTLTNTASPNANANVFVVKYNFAGFFQKAAQMGIANYAPPNNNNSGGTGISVDANNNIYVAGSFGVTTMDIYNSNGEKSATLTNNSSDNNLNAFVVKYDPNLNFLWATQMDNISSSLGSLVYISCAKFEQSVPISNICFPGNTPITTDQGIIFIKNINADSNTINGKKIVAVTRSVSQDNYLVCFEKESISKNYPVEQTIMTRHHKIFYKGKMIEAYKFLGYFMGVKKIKYTGELLYNILMEKHDKILVNNFICETLHPINDLAKVYVSDFSGEHKNKIIKLMNESIKKGNYLSYDKITSLLKKRIVFPIVK